MKKNILTLVFGVFTSIYFLVLFIQSYSKYNDGWGTDISFDYDIFIKLLCSLIILAVGIVSVYKSVKNNSSEYEYACGISLIGFITTLYPLGLMFKSIAKKKSNDTIVDYLIWAIFGAFILAYGIIRYIDYKKNAK